MRKGLGRGKGMGYKNLIVKDKVVHSQSAKGIKQPEKLGSAMSIAKFETRGEGKRLSTSDILKNILKGDDFEEIRTLVNSSSDTIKIKAYKDYSNNSPFGNRVEDVLYIYVENHRGDDVFRKRLYINRNSKEQLKDYINEGIRVFEDEWLKWKYK